MKSLTFSFIFLKSTLSLLSADLNFAWIDKKGEFTDLKYGNRNIARYVYEKMDPSDRERTYKPFHHIYQETGIDFLTKGPGGKYSHHRGIFLGFSKCKIFNNDSEIANVDTWHCKRAFQIHERTLEKNADKKSANHVVEISWKMDDGTVFITEIRSLTFSLRKDHSIQIDFKSKLSTNFNQVKLDGDPQHAGFQFRASNEVAKKTKDRTYYIRPGKGLGLSGETRNWPTNKDMKNLLWKAQCVVVGDLSYTTLYLDHPKNPKPSYYSERDYGRFGSYFATVITPQKPIRLLYRLIIGTNTRNLVNCEKLSNEFISTL